MEVRIVKKTQKNYVHFVYGNEIKNERKDLHYTENNVVFVEQDNGKPQMKEYHVNKSLMKYLCDNKKDRVNINKSLLINKFTNIFNLNRNYTVNSKEKDILRMIKENNEVIKNSLNKTFDWINFKGKVNDKLLIGLGNQSVFETSITLHHTYGIPYIPGSAIKGILRNYIIQEHFANEDETNFDEIFLEIFGGKNSKENNLQGKVIFMDAFPIESYEIHRDVMTPHHNGYFTSLNNDTMDISKFQLPQDSDKPNPISFLVMDGSNKFEFNVAVNKIIQNNISNIKNSKILSTLKNKTIREFILESLIDALNFHGIGAKTSVGYGYFDINKENVKKEMKEEFQEKERVKIEEEFTKATLGMSELKKQLYKIEKIENEEEKYSKIIEIFNENLDDLESSDKIEFATFFMNYLKNQDQWKYKVNKKGKLDKNSQRVKKVCDILKIDLPQ